MRTMIIVIMCFACLLFVSCRRYDYRTVTISVPEMKDMVSAEKIEKALSMVPGIQSEKTGVNIVDQTVTVTYDSLVTALKNIEFVIAGEGYGAFALTKDGRPARGVPANAVSTP